MTEERTIKIDRLRYTKNTASSRLVYLAILLDVFFFVSIYKSDVGSYYYNILIGASILYNLIFMLAAFLASEGVKNYKKAYTWVLLGLGAIQVARIFIIPMQAHAATITIRKVSYQVMENGQFIRVVLYLALSALCLFAAGIINLQKSNALSAHIASLEGQKA